MKLLGNGKLVEEMNEARTNLLWWASIHQGRLQEGGCGYEKVLYKKKTFFPN